MKIRSVLFLVLLFSSSLFLNAQVGKFKAAYIFNFSRYVNWPQSYNPSDFVIGVFGKDDELTEQLIGFAGVKKVQNKPIKVVVFSSVAEITSCNILYITPQNQKLFQEVKTKVEGQKVLLVTESQGSIDKGSAINFLVNSGKLAFEIKAANAEKNGLVVSNSLVNLAYKKY